MHTLERVRFTALAAAAGLAIMLVLLLVTARFAGRSTAADVAQFAGLVLGVNLVAPRLDGRARWWYVALFGAVFGLASALLRLAVLHWL